MRNQEVLARLFEADPPLWALEQLVRLWGSEEEVSRQVVVAKLAYHATHDAAEYASMARANFQPLPST